MEKFGLQVGPSTNGDAGMGLYCGRQAKSGLAFFCLALRTSTFCVYMSHTCVTTGGRIYAPTVFDCFLRTFCGHV